MQAVIQQGYTKELELHHFKPAQYLAFGKRAAAHLQWQTIAWSERSITLLTTGNGPIQQEEIFITIDNKKAILRSRLITDHYWEAVPSNKNAELFAETIAKVIAAYHKANRNLHPMHRAKYGGLVPSKSYLVTPFIVYANALVFLAMVFAGISPLHPTSQSLLLWGGNFRPAVMGGEWWRLITYMFLHGGIMHMLTNTYGLLYIGMFLEPLMGRFRFATTYILTGICAGLISIVMHPDSVCIGASGAIFGMYGVFFAILTTGHIEKTLRKTMLRSILFFIVLNLLSGLQGNTDNAAHIGGLLSGIVIGFAQYKGIAQHASPRRQWLTTALLAVGVLMTALAVLLTLRK